VHFHFYGNPSALKKSLVELIYFAAAGVARITIALSDKDHLAMKLLALQEGTSVTLLLREAIREYLISRDGYDLTIKSDSTQEQ
jgi:hypothetical protein